MGRIGRDDDQRVEPGIADKSNKDHDSMFKVNDQEADQPWSKRGTTSLRRLFEDA
jgi:hypothetical protein